MYAGRYRVRCRNAVGMPGNIAGGYGVVQASICATHGGCMNGRRHR